MPPKCIKLGRELYRRSSTMGGHIDKLGRAIGGAVGAYNQTVSSLESRVMVTARRMSELKVVEPGELERPARSPRRLAPPRRPSSPSSAWSPAKQRVPAGQASSVADAVGAERPRRDAVADRRDR